VRVVCVYCLCVCVCVFVLVYVYACVCYRQPHKGHAWEVSTLTKCL
jgi:hypothetical protein